MEKIIQGLSNINEPVIKSMLPAQLKRYKISLGFCPSFNDTIDSSDFLLIDGDKFLKQSPDTPTILEHIEQKKPVYAMLMKHDYRSRLELLNKNVLDCFEFPIMTDIISKTIRNQLMKYYSPQSESVLKDKAYTYNVASDNVYYRHIHLEFMPATDNQWFLRYRQQATSISRFEKRIIEYMITSKKLVSKKELAYVGWENFDIKDNTIIVTIKKIRNILKQLSIPIKIRNLYGYGYSMDTL